MRDASRRTFAPLAWNKETGGLTRQFVLRAVQTADGLPLMHAVHPGNVAETKTLQAMLA